MCVAVEGEVLKTDGDYAYVSSRGARMRALAKLVDIKPGDHVMVHAGCIIQKVTSAEEETFTDLSEILDEVGAW